MSPLNFFVKCQIFFDSSSDYKFFSIKTQVVILWNMDHAVMVIQVFHLSVSWATLKILNGNGTKKLFDLFWIRFFWCFDKIENSPNFLKFYKEKYKKYFKFFSEIHAPRTTGKTVIRKFCFEFPKYIFHTVVDTASIQAPAGQGCPRCGGAVFAAELVLAKGREWHRKCFKCNDCRRVLDSIIACDGPDSEVYCRGVFCFFVYVHWTQNVVKKYSMDFIVCI